MVVGLDDGAFISSSTDLESINFGVYGVVGAVVGMEGSRLAVRSHF